MRDQLKRESSEPFPVMVLLKNNPFLKLISRIAASSDIPVYIVGGAVRDLLLGRSGAAGDLDFAVDSCRFDSLVKEFAGRVRGKIVPWDFGQCRVVFRDRGRNTSVDFSKFKGENIQQDLSCRDFTVNAMALRVEDLLSGSLQGVIDPMGGRRDLAEGRVSACAPQGFDDDPLRILRAIRFERELGLVADERTRSLMQLKAPLISRVSRERVKRELFNILGQADAAGSVREMMEIGLMRMLIPELEGFKQKQQGPRHRWDLMEHSLKTVEKLNELLFMPEKELDPFAQPIKSHLKTDIEEGVTRRSLLMFSGLLHDSGKLTAGKIVDGKVSFHGHDLKGIHVNREIGLSLGLGKKAVRIVETITRNHMRLLQLSLLQRITKRAKLSLIRDGGESLIEIILLSIADAGATGTDADCMEREAQVKRIAIELLGMVPDRASESAPLLSGRDVIEAAGISEGPEIGRILEAAEEMERSGRLNSRVEALKWLKEKKSSE